MPHYLLTALGVRSYETTYELEGRTATAPLSPLALLELLQGEQRPDRVVVMLTPSARESTWPDFQEALNFLSGTLEVDPVDIPEGRSLEELRQILDRVSRCFPEGCRLTLDVTQGLRHFPFIVYALALYLTSLRNVQLEGAYYGILEGTPKGQPCPILNLRPLLELPGWFHSVRVFREQGLAQPMAEMIQQEVDRLRNQARVQGNDLQLYRQASALGNLVQSLQNMSFTYGSGLPVELGKAAYQVQQRVASVATSEPVQRRLPLVDSLADLVAQAAKTTAFAGFPPGGGQWKGEIELDKSELERQARLIDHYFQRGQISLAVGLMREWVISWSMWKGGETNQWLNRKHRERYTRRLGALAALLKSGHKERLNLSVEQEEFGSFWSRLTDALRNAFMHHGMRNDLALDTPPRHLQNVREFWERIRRGKVELPPLGGGAGCLLISPQGNKPGVLFSAIQAARQKGFSPKRCIVICSEQSVASVEKAASKADFQGECDIRLLKDPHGGFEEIEQLVRDVVSRLLQADEILANLTGGTTLMGVVVQKMVQEAKSLDRPVGQFALIDRRSPQEQDANPYVQGESYWLERPPG